MTQPHNWSEFSPRHGGGDAQPATSEDFDEICMQAFSGPAGKRLLEALRRQYIDRPENPGAPEAVLRVRVTQQQFVRDLETARDRGVEAVKRKSTNVGAA